MTLRTNWFECSAFLKKWMNIQDYNWKKFHGMRSVCWSFFRTWGWMRFFHWVFYWILWLNNAYILSPLVWKWIFHLQSNPFFINQHFVAQNSRYLLAKLFSGGFSRPKSQGRRKKSSAISLQRNLHIDPSLWSRVKYSIKFSEQSKY